MAANNEEIFEAFRELALEYMSRDSASKAAQKAELRRIVRLAFNPALEVVSLFNFIKSYVKFRHDRPVNPETALPESLWLRRMFLGTVLEEVKDRRVRRDYAKSGLILERSKCRIILTR